MLSNKQTTVRPSTPQTYSVLNTGSQNIHAGFRDVFVNKQQRSDKLVTTMTGMKTMKRKV